MHISGSGHIPAGEYNDKISVSGSGRLDGNVHCTAFSVAGSAHCAGSLTCTEDVRVSGSVHMDEGVTAASLSVSGSAHIGGDLTIKEIVRVSGSVKVDGEIKSGAVHSAGVVKIVSIPFHSPNVFSGTASFAMFFASLSVVSSRYALPPFRPDVLASADRRNLPPGARWKYFCRTTRSSGDENTNSISPRDAVTVAKQGSQSSGLRALTVLSRDQPAISPMPSVIDISGLNNKFTPPGRSSSADKIVAASSMQND